VPEADFAMPGVGVVVDEKYCIERLVGEGAMGCVYRAHHVLLGHSVAIKFLRTSVDSENVRARFIREAKATMALRSDHIVRVFDLGIFESKTPYMVLEYLEGIDLRSLLDTSGALPIEEAVDYTLQACEALAEAHANAIVHRDLKPHNLFRTRRANGSACIKLLDFGISKFEEAHSNQHELTTSHVLLGSPAFMSPEQIRSSNRVDQRADIWSLGVVLYMLVGGGRPFDGDGLPALCASIMVDPPRPLAARCPNVPPELETVILGCLEKSREHRTQNVGEVARALMPFASDEGKLTASRVVQAVGFHSQRVAYGPPSADLPTAPRARATDPTESHDMAKVMVDPSLVIRRRRSTRALGLLAGGAAMMVIAAVFMARRAESSETTSPATTTAVVAAPVAPPTSVAVSGPAGPPAVALPPDEPEGARAEAPSAAQPTAAAPTARDEPGRGRTSAGAARRPAPAAPPRGAAARPAAAAPAKKPPQVDRNGVPILE